MSSYLFILNDAPYGAERSYNGLRLAISLAKQEDTHIRVFFMGDAATCAQRGQKTPDGYYNIERMIRALTAKNVDLAVCGSCMDARGMQEDFLAGGTHRGSMEQLTAWTREADHVLVF